MFKKLRKKLFFEKLNVMFNIGLRDGKIVPIEEELYEEMNKTIIACLPVGTRIKYADQLFAQGTCYERSLYMFLALDNAILVRGNNKDLEYNYGKGHEGHGWVELGDYVYDPSLGYRFDKELYYKLYGSSDLAKCDKETYLKEHSDFVDKYVSTDLNDFRPGGKRRLDLGIIIYQTMVGANLSNNESLLTDLQSFLDNIQYDPSQIKKEREESMDLIFSKVLG